MSRVVEHKKRRVMPASEGERKQDSFLEERIDQLINYTKRLRRLSRLLLILLIYNFSLIVAMAYTKKGFSDPSSLLSQTDIIFLVIFSSIFFMAFVCLFQFNKVRKQGMSLYGEITDDIDWSSKRREYIHRPSAKARVLIRDFLLATDLPFTSGVNGQAIYFLGFLVMLLSVVIIQVKF